MGAIVARAVAIAILAKSFQFDNVTGLAETSHKEYGWIRDENGKWVSVAAGADCEGHREARAAGAGVMDTDWESG